MIDWKDIFLKLLYYVLVCAALVLVAFVIYWCREYRVVAVIVGVLVTVSSCVATYYVGESFFFKKRVRLFENNACVIGKEISRYTKINYTELESEIKDKVSWCAQKIKERRPDSDLDYLRYLFAMDDYRSFSLACALIRAEYLYYDDDREEVEHQLQEAVKYRESISADRINRVLDIYDTYTRHNNTDDVIAITAVVTMFVGAILSALIVGIE